MRINTLILGIFLLIIPIPVTTQTIDKIDLNPITNFELDSSHWEPQKVDGDIVSSKFKNLKTQQDEYYNGSINYENNGNDIEFIKGNIQVILGDIIVYRNITISEWKSSNIYLIELNYIKIPSLISWENAKVSFDWETVDSNDNILTQSHIIDIVRKGDESPSIINPDKLDKDPDLGDLDHDTHEQPLSQHSVDSNFIGKILPQTHIGDVVDLWEGSSSGSSSYNKGLGPTLRVKVVFSGPASPGFYMDYTIESTTHSWTATYTHYWSGTYQSTTITFALTLGWSFVNGQYSFGQGSYKFTKAKAYMPNAWNDVLSQSDTNDQFQINNPSSINKVFLITIHDSYYTDSPNCLGSYSERYYVDKATDRFEANFDISYETYIKEKDWQTDVSSDNILGCSGTEKSTDNAWDEWSSIGSIAYTARTGIGSALGLTGGKWSLGDTTQKWNHGYDQALAMSGVFHADNHAMGKGDNPGNIALAMPGWIDSYLDYYVIGTRYNQVIQHELSHNFDADHDDTPWYDYHIMRNSFTYTNDQWQDPAETTIENNIYQFTNTP